jgi:hypothetical protein
LNEQEASLRRLLSEQAPQAGWHSDFLGWARHRVDNHASVAPLKLSTIAVRADWRGLWLYVSLALWPTSSAASVDQLPFWFLSDFNCMISCRRARPVQRRFHIRSLDQYVTMETKVGLI